LFVQEDLHEILAAEEALEQMDQSEALDH